MHGFTTALVKYTTFKYTENLSISVKFCSEFFSKYCVLWKSMRYTLKCLYAICHTCLVQDWQSSLSINTEPSMKHILNPLTRICQVTAVHSIWVKLHCEVSSHAVWAVQGIVCFSGSFCENSYRIFLLIFISCWVHTMLVSFLKSSLKLLAGTEWATLKFHIYNFILGGWVLPLLECTCSCSAWILY